MSKKKVLCVVGTRPEVIKMAPVILLLRKEKNIDLLVLSVAQHREMLDQMMKTFEIEADQDLNIMQKEQTLPQLTARLPVVLDEFLAYTKPDMVVGQGDTTAAFLISLASFYRQIPFNHIEAGLRTGNFNHPFPEEMNRVLISHLSTLHFAPTNLAKENLLKEGISGKKIFVTGNTVVDALNIILAKNKSPTGSYKNKRLLLVTAHRRENIGDRLKQICRAIRKIVDYNFNVEVFFSVHPNPSVSRIVLEELSNHPKIILSQPLRYEDFIMKMKEAYLILTDSGGIQEEAVSLNIPVLVLRDTTERPEGINMGASLLIGTEINNIVEAVQRLLDNKNTHLAMTQKTSPYGNGNAAQNIINILKSVV